MKQGLNPTHSISIFPSWLTREEWEAQGFPNVSKGEQIERIERRISFLAEIDQHFPQGLNEVEKGSSCFSEDGRFSQEKAIDAYKEGGYGGILACCDNLAFIQPWFTSDDSDHMWIFSIDILREITDIAEKLGLFIIKNCGPGESGNGIPRATS